MSLDESLRLTLWRYLRGRKGDERQNDLSLGEDSASDAEEVEEWLPFRWWPDKGEYGE
jgi:hypothetical protein